MSYKWYRYLWIWAIIYFVLGFFNILFAWLGMIDFCVPIFLAIAFGNKSFCNKYCARGQLLRVIGNKFSWSRNVLTPTWLSAKWFRYSFLVFFLAMFCNMLFQTYLVAANVTTLEAFITLFWTIQIPWQWAYTPGIAADWVIKFSFGFYSLMLTSLILGIISLVLYKPRSWCAYCPMGTMTQEICKLRRKI